MFDPEKAGRNNPDFFNHKFPAIKAYISSQGYIWVLLCLIFKHGVAIRRHKIDAYKERLHDKEIYNQHREPTSAFNVKPASRLMCQILFVDTERDNQGREAEG